MEYNEWLEKYDLEDNEDNRYLYEVKDDMGWWFDEYLPVKEDLPQALINAIECL